MRALTLLPLALLAACSGSVSSSATADVPVEATADAAIDVASDVAACPLPTVESTACASDAECAPVARRCYCGAQPVEGVNVAYAVRAALCEAESAMSCALGCAVFPGQQAQDGQTTEDGGVIAARCERDAGVGRCVTFVR